MRVADAVATVAGHILARLRDDLTPAQEIVLRRALTAEAERINPARKNGAPGWTPGTPPNQAAPLGGTTAMTRSIPRRAHDVHAGDIITHDPAHDRPVRWKASRRAAVTADGVAIIDYADLDDLGAEGIAYYGGLVELTVEPAGGAQ